MHKLSIIIPAYNEEETILEILAKIDGLDLGKIEKEVIHDSAGKEIKQKSYDSKVILIIGHWDQVKGDIDLTKKTKIKTFELFRRDSRNVEIITYDELYDRAKYIVNSSNA